MNFLSSDKNFASQVKAKVNQIFSGKEKYIFLVGIGGSNLGAKAMYDAKYGYFDSFEANRFPKLFFIDANDPELLIRSRDIINKCSAPEELAVITVSKSGITLETRANLDALETDFSKRFGDAPERFIVVTMENSDLWQYAQNKGFHRVTFPADVSGRFSVFTAAGLVPLFAAKLDGESLVAGAREAYQLYEDDLNKNPAHDLASWVFEGLKIDKSIFDLFLFHPELESLGKWWRQLYAESLGKKEANFVLNPTVSIGSTDLHSVGQLYLDKPEHRATIFVWSDSVADGKSSEVSKNIFEAAKKAYSEKNIPFMEVILPEISEFHMGRFMMNQMLAVLYLGNLMGVDVFSQPAVETYKESIVS